MAKITDLLYKDVSRSLSEEPTTALLLGPTLSLFSSLLRLSALATETVPDARAKGADAFA
jgi:hypothetical protein